MKSQIVLYKNCKIVPDRNLLLDNIRNSSPQAVENYLSTISSSNKTTIDGFQYVKHSLTLSIKVKMTQSNLQMTASKDYNYVKIRNYTENEGGTKTYEKSYYYFVINKKWVSTDTIEFVLNMDTLNSFAYDVDYYVSSKSLVKRQHKDRFYKIYKDLHAITINANSFGITFPSGWCNHKIQNCTISFYNSSTTSRKNFDNKTIKLTNTGLLSELGLHLYSFIGEDLEWINTNYYNNNWVLDWIDVNGVQFNLNTTIHINDFDRTLDYARQIDLKSEDISCPVYKEKENIINDGTSTYNWSLYYKNRDNQEGSPVDCYLVTEQSVNMKVSSTTNAINVNSITIGKIVLIVPSYQGELSFDINGQIRTIRYEEVDETYDHYDMYYCIAFENVGGQLKVTFPLYMRQQGQHTLYKSGTWNQEVTNATAIYLGALDSIAGYETTSLSNFNNDFPASNFTFSFTAGTSIVLNTKDTIDRTLEENLKIINVPYCPSNFDIDSSNYITITPEWTYDSTYKFLRLQDLNTRFSHEVVSSLPNILDNFDITLSINNMASRYLKDSKLLHSDYFRPKFVYDSFYKVFALEHINFYKSLDATEYDYFNFKFVMSRNIVSKFLFKFNFVYDYANEDYENIVAVSRNNEEVLYNSSYLDYVRTGFNFDLKAKERQEVTSGVTIGLSALGLVASGVAGAMTGNPIAVGGVIGSAISLTTSLINYAKTTAQNEENIQRKLQESQRQAVSVLNADDYDLLYEYSSNRAKLCVYKVSPLMESILDDLFYYGGYVLNEQRKPDVTSRLWFNFVQASLVFNTTSNLPIEIENDIKEKFEQGVTFLHYQTSLSTKLDFGQEKENWEMSIL